ncbi:DUF4258 domain-containing protein [Acinetobacter sp. MD2(2019)]|uniref:DUF4258 domain-containing protein n=1 Tax=Acinetobacter sp. MD2(2019) TaxID=2605273 RepID=UPI002D1F47F9|nr:DUF4258 domain-containing protein [Acinetobacter sp. MD2(2019)]MEB3754895.1 DUF4258 domain-containing protein [Acinetobacter sp. MD2(2019)]
MCLTEIEAKRKLREIAKDTRKIKLSAHARERMKERNISLKQIICCFEHGDIIEGPYADTRGDCKLNVSVRTAGEIITTTVVIKVCENGDFSIVVTTFKE